nr:hypothetical protein [Streptoalloteichus tenebrarius]
MARTPADPTIEERQALMAIRDHEPNLLVLSREVANRPTRSRMIVK